MRSLRAIPFAAVLVLSAPALQAQERLPADSMELGRKFSEWFYNGMADSLYSRMDAVSQSRVTVAQINEAILTVASRAGNEISLIEEKFITRNGARQYWRTSKMDGVDEPFLLRFVINSKGELTGYGMGLARQAPPID